jgi:hypothetical protein
MQNKFCNDEAAILYKDCQIEIAASLGRRVFSDLPQIFDRR